MLFRCLLVKKKNVTLAHKNDITILAPSKEPQDLSGSFPGMQIVNPVQVVVKHEELHYAVCKAIDKITTKFFYIYDYDDDVPELPETFPNAGVIFGDIWICYRGVTKRHPVTRWSFNRHFNSPQLIHRPICRTEDAKRILKDVAHLPILTEWWLTAHLAKDSGYHYDPSLVMLWNKKDTGLHKKSSEVIENTQKLFNMTYPEFSRLNKGKQ